MSGRLGGPLACLVVVLAVVGLAVGPGLRAPAAAAPASVGRVLILAVPGLQWEDVARTRPPALGALAAQSAVASLSIRTADDTTDVADGYASLGAGERVAVPKALLAPVQAGPAGGGLVEPALPDLRRRASGGTYDARPGALGDALAAAGRATAVVSRSPAAVLALADRTGRVGGGVVRPDLDGAALTAATQAALAASTVVLTEVADLSAVPGGAERDRAVTAADGVVAGLVALADPATDLVVLVAPNAPHGASALTVFGLAGPGIDAGRARSPTTRRAGYVTLPDVAPTVLDRLGRAVPEEMGGTPITSAGGRISASALARADRVARFRDRAVAPVVVAYVVLQVLGYAVAIAAVRGRRRLAAPALAAALVVLALPVVTFLAGLVAPEGGSVALYTVALFAVAGALAAAVWFPLRARPWAAPLVLFAATWVVLVLDVASGGRLQLDTVLGYSPTIAGRFQGYGNLAFALLSSVAVVLATGWFGWRRGTRRALLAAGALLAVTVVVDGFPALGADVGGVLASAPAYAIVIALLARWRLGWRRVLAVAGGAVGLVLVFALVDLARPPASRTHLGRFADRLVHGEAGTIVRRKVVTNLEVVVRQPAALLVPLLFVAFVLLVRRSGTVVAVRRRVLGLDPCLIGLGVLAVVGFAVNDSGLAIPAMMIGVVVPWLVVLVLRGSPP